MSPEQVDSTSNSIMNSPGIILSPTSQNRKTSDNLRIENQESTQQTKENLDTLVEAQDPKEDLISPPPAKGFKNQSMISVLNIRQESHSNERTEPTRTVDEDNELVADSKSDHGE